MKIRFRVFNIYLLTGVVAFGVGCRTTEEKKRDQEASTLRFHLETNSDGTERNSGVPVYRQHPMLVNVLREAFLNEGDVELASVVDVLGGFSIQIQFNRHGTFVLDTVTAANKGRRIAIQSQFGETRWLAAPVIRQRIQNGAFIFTPDASREESERIVRGINNVVKAVKKKSSF